MAQRRSQPGQLGNLGPNSTAWLNAIGVFTRRDLEKLGAVDACRILRAHGYNATLNLVYGIEAALRALDWKHLPAALRKQLQAAYTESLKPRCEWCETDPVYRRYHDEEWGVPVHDDRRLFEFLILEGAQAGLSWLTILRKREHYREAYAGFAPERVARFDARRQARLLNNPGIVRNRLKIGAAVTNARAFLGVQREFGSFDAYVWKFVGGRPIRNHRRSLKEIPATTPESDALSKDLKRRGFRFVGSTICYAFMQATGMVNDHLVHCFRHRELARHTARRTSSED
jgi:DNA-3-methyladenine glycosylase I